MSTSDRPAADRSRWAAPAALVLIGLAAIAAYSNSLNGPFIFDDTGSIVENASIRHLWPPGGALSPPYSDGQTVGGRPVLNLSFALNYAVGGLDVRGYHAVNLAIHILAGLVLFGIVRRTAGRMRSGVRRIDSAEACLAAFAAALLWTLHPLQTESVTYVVQRAESLMGLFYLLTLYCFIRSAGDCRRGRWTFLAFAACLLGMATKEVMVSAPLMVLLYDRAFLAGSFRESLRCRWRTHALLASTWVLLGFLILSARNRGGSVGFGQVSWIAYALTQFPAILRYLHLAVWPSPLIFDYGAEWIARPWSVLPEALVVISMAAAAVILFWRRPALGFLGLWFFAILAPTSLMPGNRQTLAEHRMYLALIPVVVAAVWAGSRWLRRPIAWIAVAVLGIAAGAATAERNTAYRNDLSLWGDTAAKRPNNPFAHNNLGVALFDRNELAKSRAQYERALQLWPDYPEAHMNLGNSLRVEGSLEGAVRELEQALRLKPDYADAYNDLGLTLRAAGNVDGAVADFEQALRIRPRFAETRVNLGNIFGERKQWKEAVSQFEEALRDDPRRAEAQYGLGTTLLLAGRAAEAVAPLQEALRCRPNYPEARQNLDLALNAAAGEVR